MQADLAGDVRSYIIAPSAVHGPGTGPVGRTSVFVRLITEAYVIAGKAFVIGEGTNVFGYVSGPVISTSSNLQVHSPL